jgi:hypothetical protein
MRKFWITLCLLGVALILFNQWKLNSRLAERQSLSQLEASPPTNNGNELAALQDKLNQVNSELASAELRLTNLSTLIAALENKAANLNSNLSKSSRFTLSPEPINAVPEAPVKRSWGPEQATGAPNTMSAGDIPTAWASLNPDGGVEWLKLDYQNPADIAQIRIRETYNPGAVFKITALSAIGQEYTLWEGTETPEAAPFDSVFDIPGNVYAQSIIIYLDTTRVSGWNEIDAVELVSKTGHRQWASQATASSTYAERSSLAAQPPASDLTPK